MISVIIPTYNRALFLKEAVQSVLEQDHFIREEFELIIIDDGSEDDTGEVISSFGERVRYFYQENKGVSAARNLGLSLARGDFIAFLDSDDLWMKEKMRVQMNFMCHHPKAKVCYTEEIWLRGGRRVNPMKKHAKYSGLVFDKVLPLCLISLSSALFKSEVFEEVGKFDEELPVCEDYDFGIRIAQRYPVFFLPQPLIIKRGGHGDQLSRRYWGMDRFRVRALVKALSLELDPRQDFLVRQEIDRKCQILAGGFEKRGNHREAREYRALAEKYRCSQSHGS